MLAHSRYSICAGHLARMLQGELQCWSRLNGARFFPCCDHFIGKEKLPFMKALNVFRPLLPFQGGWLGWLGYGAAWEIETLPHL